MCDLFQLDLLLQRLRANVESLGQAYLESVRDECLLTLDIIGNTLRLQIVELLVIPWQVLVHDNRGRLPLHVALINGLGICRDTALLALFFLLLLLLL